MLGTKMEAALNDQINAELFSSYLYLSMVADFESKNMRGAANWMRIQAGEELMHATKFFDFINERSGRVVLGQIEKPKTEWDSPLAAFEDALEHEKMISGRINDLVDLALAEKDHATNTFLQWFVTEQVEEEANAQAIVDKLKMVGDHGVAIFMVDGELGKRVAAPATDTPA